MANSLYHEARQALIVGDIDWINDDIRVIPVSNAYAVDLTSHVFLSDIPGGVRLAGAQPLTGRLIVGGAATGDTTTFLSIFDVDVQAIFIYKHTTVENTSNLIAYLDTAVGLPLHVSNGLIIHWEQGPGKIFTMPSGGLVSSVAGRVGDIVLTAADISGIADAYTLPTATDTVLGGVKVDGTSITISNGVISGANTYTLPIADDANLGGVKVGSGLTIDGQGVLSANGVSSYNDLTGTPIPLTAQGTVADVESGDPYWASTVLLLGMDGLVNSTTFTDSARGKTVTAGSGAKITNAVQKFSGNNTLVLNGTSDYLTIPTGTDFDFGSTDLTIEAWVYLNVSVTAHRIISSQNGGTYWCLRLDPYPTFFHSAALSLNSSTPLVMNTWNHIAVSRNGSTWNLYVNGELKATASNAAVMPYPASTIYISSYNATGEWWSGYIDDLRITKGVGRYPAAFTPPQSSLLSGQSDPYWANTQLLFHMDGLNNSTTIIESAKSTAVTVYGGAKLSSTRSMFGPTSAYFTGTTSDYMTVPGATFSPGTGDFTIECWIYKTSYTGSGVGNDETIFGCGTGSGGGNLGFYLNNNDGYPKTWDGSTSTGSSIRVLLNQWTHVAWVRQSGIFKIFVNGVLGLIQAYAYSIVPTTVWRIGGQMHGDNTRWFSGWIDELRVSNIARYSGTFIPAASQFLSGNSDTQWNNVVSLLHFDGTDGSTTITDTKGTVAWTTVGAAVLSGSQKAFGTTSLRTTGATQDYVRTSTTTNTFGLLNADVATIEFWVQPINSVNGCLIDNQSYSGINEKNWTFWYNGSTVGFLVGDSNTGTQQLVVTSSASLTVNSWNHVAVTKNGTSCTIWINGVSSGTGTISITMGNRADRWLVIGSYYNLPAVSNFRGYIDEFRFTKNVVRYTTTFQPNASAFPDGMATPGSIQFNRKGSLAGSPLLVWDELNNRLGVGVANPTAPLDILGGIKSTSGLTVTPVGDGTGQTAIELGAGRTGNGYAYIDLIGDNDSVATRDYGLRIIRNNGGQNTTSEIAHRGTGALYVRTQDAAQLVLQTSAVDRVTVSATAANVGIGGAPVAGYAVYAYANMTTKLDQAVSTANYVENLNGSNGAQSLFSTQTGSGYTNLSSVGTGWSVGAGGDWEVLNGGAGYINTSTPKLNLISFNASGVLNILTGGAKNSNIRARWSAAGNLALGYGDLTDATEKLQLKAGNIKLDGTTGVHGLIFPDLVKQTYAFVPGGTSTYDFSLDANYASVTFLSHFSGTNGSTTVTDNSGTPKTTVVNGSARISTSDYKFSPSSIFFDGTGNCYTDTNHADIALGNGSFTIEFWVRSVSGSNNGVFEISNALDSSWDICMMTGGNNLELRMGTVYSASVTVTNWNHVAIVRNGSTVMFYINGTQVTSFSNSTTFTKTHLYLGAYYSNAYCFNGYIDEFRITKGVARYLSNFVVATSPFSNSATQTSVNSIQYLKGTSAQGITGSANFVFDEINVKLGVGTATPQAKVQVHNTDNSASVLMVSTPGTGTSQESCLQLLTKTDGISTGGVNTTFWHITARGNAYADATMRNHLIQWYWNGTAWAHASTVGPTGKTMFGGDGTSSPAEVLHVKSGNMKLEGTVGTHGLIFPDASKQLYAADQYNVKDNTAAPSATQWRVWINSVPDGIISIAELRFFDMTSTEISSSATYSTTGNSGTWTSYGSLYDGDYSGSFWDFTGGTQALKVSFATPKTLKFIRLGPRTGYLTRMPANVTVQYSLDGGTNWISQVTAVPTTGWANATLKEVQVTTVDPQIPIDITKISYQVRYDLGKYEVYGSPVGASLVWTKHFDVSAAGSSLRGDVTVLGISGTDGIIFPDATKQTTAGNPQGYTSYVVPGNPFASTKFFMSMNGTNGTSTFTEYNGASVVSNYGPPTLSNVQYKFGTTSMDLTGVSHSAYVNNIGSVLAFGAGDFTYECWIYPTAGTGTPDRTIICNGDFNTVWLGMDDSDRLFFRATSLQFGGTSAHLIAMNTWTHVAVVKSGTLKIFINGALISTDSSAGINVPTAGRVYIGDVNGTKKWRGYIDDLAISSVARYSVSFTAPAAEYSGDIIPSVNAIQYNRGGKFFGTTSFVYDELNNMVGIGTVAPTERLHTSGGNWKMEGTSGTHGIIFPDGSKQTTAGRTEAQVNAAIQAVVDAAPAALDTLNELAAALGDDANFAGSVTTALSLKADISSLAAVATSGLYSDLTGTPSPYVLPIATGASLGGIMVDGTTIVVDGSGVLSATGGGASGYTLPAASATILGGVKIGAGLAIDGSGVVDVTGKASLSYLHTFVNTDLTAGNITITHSLGTQYCVVQIYDDTNRIIIPDEVTMVDANNLTLDLTSFGTLTGTWHARIVP